MSENHLTVMKTPFQNIGNMELVNRTLTGKIPGVGEFPSCDCIGKSGTRYALHTRVLSIFSRLHYRRLEIDTKGKMDVYICRPMYPLAFIETRNVFIHNSPLGCRKARVIHIPYIVYVCTCVASRSSG